MTHEQKPESSEFLRNARAMQAKVKRRLAESAEFRTREAQIGDLALSMDAAYPLVIAEKHILEAEARGAAEQRRKDAEGAVAWVDPTFLPSSDCPWTDARLLLEDGTKGTIPLYTRPTNVAALEARVKELEGCEKDAVRFRWLVENVGLYYGIPGFAAERGRSPEKRIDDLLRAIDANIVRSAAAITNEGRS